MHLTALARFSVCLLALMLSVPGNTQELKKRDRSQDVSSLRKEVQNVESQQQQMLATLNDIKQLLAANVGARPTPQPPVPPTALTTQKEDFRGNSGAAVAIVEYADFECPFCGQYEREVYPQLAKDYIDTGKVKYFYRDLPLPMHPHAMVAARAARCAGAQGKFWEMHDSLFAKQNLLRDVDMPARAQEVGLDTAKFSECLSSDRYTEDINKSAAEAQRMGVEGTPTFFVGQVNPNGELTNLKMIVGSRSYDAFKSVIDGLLTEIF